MEKKWSEEKGTFLDPKDTKTPSNRLTAAIRRTTRPAIRDFATIFLQEKRRTADVCRSRLSRRLVSGSNGTLVLTAFVSWVGS